MTITVQKKRCHWAKKLHYPIKQIQAGYRFEVSMWSKKLANAILQAHIWPFKNNLIWLFIVSISSNSVPSQGESLVDAIVVDELDLESPIRVEGQSAPREHQVDLELVGWGQDEIENHDTKVISKLMYNTFKSDGSSHLPQKGSVSLVRR